MSVDYDQKPTVTHRQLVRQYRHLTGETPSRTATLPSQYAPAK